LTHLPEHSHEKFLIATNTALKVNNPEGFIDAVFALLGNAAASQSLGKTMKDPACLQQAIADQAFSNAKAANDLAGQTAALVFRTLERNSGTVGGKSDPCTSIQAVNPEIAALEQHQVHHSHFPCLDGYVFLLFCPRIPHRQVQLL